MSEELISAGCTSAAYHGKSRPAVAEIEAVSRLITLARALDSAIYFVHLSTPEAVELCAEARQLGQPVIAESCPQYLVLDNSMYEGEYPEEFVFSPPLRSVKRRNRMQAHLRAGNIKVVGSDHCAFLRAQKRQASSFSNAPPGIPGVETSLQVLYSRLVATEGLPIHQLMKTLSRNPAIVYGLYPKKGALKVGSDADVVIYDPSGHYVLRDEDLHGPPGSYTPFAGETIYGKVLTTISRGRLVYHNGEFKGDPTHGQFVPGEPFNPAVVASL
jgi:dihydropyrimidinase